MSIKNLPSNFIDRKALGPSRTYTDDTHREGRSEPAGAATQEFAVATDRYLDPLSRIKRPAAEFNALHVGYFAVPPCTTVKVHAGAHACACTHTRGQRSARRPAGSLHSPHAPYGMSSYSSRSFVRSFAHAARIDIGKEKSFPFVAKRGKYDEVTLRPAGDLHNT